MIFAAAAAALGIALPLNAEARRSKIAADQAAIEAKRGVDVRYHEEQRSLVNEAAATKSARIVADAEAFELKLSKDIAADFRKTVTPLMSAWHHQPSRKLVVQLKTEIYSTDQIVQKQLNARLDHLQIATSFVESILSAESPDLLSAAHAIEFYHGPAISAATRLLEAAGGDYIVEFEKALEDLEQALEVSSRMSPRSTLSEEHEQSFDALCAYAIPAHRGQATQDLTLTFANQRSAKISAAYVRPYSVDSDGSVGVNGAPVVAPVINYDTPLLQGSEDGVSTVERGVQSTDKTSAPDAHFDKLAASMPDLNRI